MTGGAQLIRGGKFDHQGIFEAWELQEAAGAHTGFNRDSAETATPQDFLSTTIRPLQVQSGIIQKIKIRLNWVNAVTLDQFWIFESALAGDYESRMRKLWDSIDTLPGGIIDDTEYEFDVDIPFWLSDPGRFYYMQDLSAANGNIQGYVFLSGITFEV